MQTLTFMAKFEKFDHNEAYSLLRRRLKDSLPNRNARFTVGLVATCLFIVAGALLLAGFEIPTVSGTGIVICAVIAFAVITKNEEKQISNALNTASTRFGEKTFELSSEGVKMTGDHGFSLTYWSAIRDVISTPQGLLLLLSPLDYIPLPADSFASAEEQEATLHQTKTWIKSAT